MNKREYINDKYYVEKVGVGKPLYIIGGGPGLDYSYMYKWFVDLSDTRELVFYNQYGLYDNENTSLDILIEQLHEILIHDNNSKDVLVHSFGIHLLLSVLSKYDDVNIDKIVAINPTPINYEKYIESGNKLLEKIPETVKEKICYLENKKIKEAGLMIMSLLLPYYTYNEKVNIDFGMYNNSMCDKINSQIKEFDFSNLISKLKNDILIIKGECDFISITDTLKLQMIAKKVIIYPECGHFAFAEKSKESLKEIRKFINS